MEIVEVQFFKEMKIIAKKVAKPTYTVRKDRADRREFSDELKKEITDLYIKLVNGDKSFFAKMLNVNQNVISRWTRSRKKESIKNTKRRAAKFQSLKTKSIAAGGKIIGTALSSILSTIPSSDIVAQSEMVGILTDAGFKEDNLVSHLTIEAPSIENWKEINRALKLLSKDYTITRKDNE